MTPNADDPRHAGPPSPPGADGVLLAYRAADVGYDGVSVVRGADLQVSSGELVGLVGPNGAGKSTLLRAVTGDAELLGGVIELVGEPITALAPARRARLVGVVPQQVTAAFGVTALDFVEMGRHPHMPRFGGAGRADRAAVERAMRRTDTTRLADMRTDALSGGDLQRLSLAQALAQEPQVLLLDEPVSHLDLNHRLQVLDLVRELADGGLGVLAVFHDLDLAARYADRLAVVASGSLGAAAPPEAVLTSEMVREVFGVRAVVSTDPVSGAVTVTPVLREDAVLEAGVRGSVFVVAGSGTGARLLRRLALTGWTVMTAALNRGDVDEGVASALGIEHPVLSPFGGIDADARSQAAALAARAEAVVVCETPFGSANLANLEIAVESGRPLVLIGSIEGRDFAGGEATRLWSRALDRGAIAVDDHDGAVRVLDALVHREV